MKTVLLIGGSDSSGGAGIQADIKTLAALGLYGVTAVTSITAQNQDGIRQRYDLPHKLVAAQIDAAVAAADCRAVKIGMLGSARTARVVFEKLSEHHLSNVVLDPVFAAEAGGPLADRELPEILLAELSQISLITPNIIEARRLTGREIQSTADMEAAAADLHNRGSRAVLVTGGHLDLDPIVDIFLDSNGPHRFESPRLEVRPKTGLAGSVHGTGCTLSSAIAAYLAGGKPLKEAVDQARRFVYAAIEEAVVLKNGWRIANQAAGSRALRQG